jgi:4-hydroxybenzoate polyprenyltransferase
MAMSARGIYQILRLPLFITAVADVVAGYMVASLTDLSAHAIDWPLLALLAGTSMGLYLFGMVENDLVDIRRDRLMKISRPLVTGRLSLAWAIVLLVLTAGLAAGCTAGLMVVNASHHQGQTQGGAVVLVLATFAAINFYNLAAKFGPSYICMTVMGLCRLLNVGIGITAAVGFPQHERLALLMPTGPLWPKLALTLFCVTAMISGYSICARSGYKVSARPWQFAFVATIVVGLGMWMLAGLNAFAAFPSQGGHPLEGGLLPPLGRALALVVLPLLWPGKLFSPLGPQRKPEEYGKFIERTIYWMIALDAGFVLDALLLRRGMLL